MNRKVRRFFAAVLAAVMASVLFAGCSAGKKETDQNTLTLNLRIKDMDAFLAALQEEFPNIHFEVYQYGGADTTNFLYQTLVNGQPSDLFFHTQKVPDELAKENLLDLSSYAFLDNIDQAMLNQFDVEGHIYQLPGPVSVRYVAYNKTIFEEHGWTKPKNHRELVELVKQIRREAPELIPIAMSLGGVGYPFTCVTTFSQAGFLSTPDGIEWERKYLAGEASVAEGWSEGFAIMTDLINAGAFYGDEEFIGVWDDTVIRQHFGNGEAAMIFVLGGQQALADLEQSSDYEFALMPFYGLEDGQELLGVNVSCTWGINKALADKGNEKKLENALRVMEWLSSPAGQELLISNNTEIPSLKDANIDSVSGFYKELWDVAVNGHKAAMIYAGYEDVIIEAGTLIQEYMLSGDADGMAEAVTKLVDETHANALTNAADAVNYGEIGEDLTAEQTVQLMANVLNSAGLADFAMVTRGGKQGSSGNKSGVSGWLYAGIVDNATCMIPMPGSSPFVVVLTLKGSLIKTMLEEGKYVAAAENGGDGYSWPYYWAGIEVSMNEGKVTSVKLDGNEIKDDAFYKVLFADSDYTEEVAAEGNPADTGVKMLDLYVDYLGENSPVPAPEVLRK